MQIKHTCEIAAGSLVFSAQDCITKLDTEAILQISRVRMFGK